MARGVKRANEPAMRPDACRRIRLELRLTQEQFAQQLGVRPLTIILWETGRTPISKSRAMAIRYVAGEPCGDVDCPVWATTTTLTGHRHLKRKGK